MAVEQAKRDLLERGLDRRDLGQDVDAVAVVLDHPLDAADLALDAAQAGEELVLARRVAATGRRRAWAVRRPWRGSYSTPPGYTPRHKPYTPYPYRKELLMSDTDRNYTVTGMTCGHCKSSVLTEVLQVQGVARPTSTSRPAH